MNLRTDGRTNLATRNFTCEQGTIAEAYGSATLTFGEEQTMVICAIKAEVQKPLPSEPSKGQIYFHLESSQTGTSLFTREDEADETRQRMLQILQTLYGNIIDRSELSLYKDEFAWTLNVDVLVFDELALH